MRNRGQRTGRDPGAKSLGKVVIYADLLEAGKVHDFRVWGLQGGM